jgi:hypothetical protein
MRPSGGLAFDTHRRSGAQNFFVFCLLFFLFIVMLQSAYPGYIPVSGRLLWLIAGLVWYTALALETLTRGLWFERAAIPQCKVNISGILILPEKLIHVDLLRLPRTPYRYILEGWNTKMRQSCKQPCRVPGWATIVPERTAHR